MLTDIIEYYWDKYDDDHNGYIDKKEFTMFLIEIFGEDLRNLFKYSDLQGDSFINKKMSFNDDVSEDSSEIE